MVRWLLLQLILSAALLAQTSLWKVTYEGKTLYLGGTIHVLRPSDFPLPKAYEAAFSSADRLIFETDFGKMDLPQTAVEMQQRLMCEAGKSLNDHLRLASYMELKKYADAHRLPMAVLDRMKPQLVVISVMGAELQRLGISEKGVDQYFFARASEAGKPIGWFESVQEQIGMIESMGSENPDKMVEQTLGEMMQYELVMSTMLSAWRTGDAESLERLGKTYLMHDSPADYRRLIVERNRRWMEQIKPMLKSPETELILVGALHLVGTEGLISRLKRAGCKVEQL